MKDIQQLLADLASARLTPKILSALDFVVPGEWSNVTSLDEAVRQYLGVTDPGEVARIKARALELWQSQPHYGRAVKIYSAVDTADKAVAAAVVANQVGNAFSLLSVLDKITPKPDTVQAVDAALKLAAELAAFATLRGLPLSSMAAAKAFPATLGTYAKADMMRLSAWIAIDGLLPLGPEFVQKIVHLVQSADVGSMTKSPVFQQVKDILPGGNVEEQKGFVLSALSGGAAWVSEFVRARGLTQEGLAQKLGGLLQAADKSMDVLAAGLDATTNYYAHTGVQSVARVLVHDAQVSLASGQPVGAATPASAEAGSSWFKTAAAVAGVGTVAAAGAALYKKWSADDEDDADDDSPDPELDGLDDNALAARESAIEMEARDLLGGNLSDAEKDQSLQKLRRQRRRLRRMRRMRRNRRGGGGGGGGGRRG